MKLVIWKSIFGRRHHLRGATGGKWYGAARCHWKDSTSLLRTQWGSYIGPNQGVATVHYFATQKGFSVNVPVHNAQPDTSYRVDIHCWIFGPQNAIGVLTANYQGTGTAQIDLYMETVPTQSFFH